MRKAFSERLSMSRKNRKTFCEYLSMSKNNRKTIFERLSMSRKNRKTFSERLSMSRKNRKTFSERFSISPKNMMWWVEQVRRHCVRWRTTRRHGHGEAFWRKTVFACAQGICDGVDASRLKEYVAVGH